MAKTIVGLYDDRATAHTVLTDLESAGFGQDHLRFASPENGDATDYDIDVTNDTTPAALGKYGVADDEARFYSEGVRRGGSIVIARVHDGDVERAVDVMAGHNPVRFEDRGADYLADYDEARTYTADQVVENRNRYADKSKQRLQEIEEHLKIGKRDVVRGGVRVNQYVETDVEEETLRLREEEAVVDRTAINRELTPEQADAAFEAKTVEVVETGQEAVVEKTAVVTGEVAVGKDVNVREEVVGGEVRSTRVEVEQIEGEVLTAATPAFREHYTTAYASTGRDFSDYEPAYKYGYAAGQTYSDRDYAAVENDLRSDYSTRYNDGDDSVWDDFKDAVRHGYNKAKAAV
ncbi:YsnF/AvaK domain-containing protein [Rubrivirga sp.]|uniref:YsnF/AvaK domain-containing protein n=1 Tax=Rubrivirga sp. TaxID=1885344 RepID=UPI003C720442